jgi:hypothetical protein
MPRRILSVTGTRAGTASRTRDTISSAEDLLHGAAEVDVDDVEARLDQPHRRRREGVGVGAHQLAADGMLTGIHGDPGEVAPVGADHHHERVEQHLADRVGRAVPPRQQPHRQVAVARQRRLQQRRFERHAADRQRPRHRRFHVSTGHRSNHVRPCASIHCVLAAGPQSPGV